MIGAEGGQSVFFIKAEILQAYANIPSILWVLQHGSTVPAVGAAKGAKISRISNCQSRS
jgi:hypothetical protein